MWTRIALKPWWARALAWAGVYAIFAVGDWCARGLAPDPNETWLFTLAGRVVSIVIFGLLAAAFTSNSYRARRMRRQAI